MAKTQDTAVGITKEGVSAKDTSRDSLIGLIVLLAILSYFQMAIATVIVVVCVVGSLIGIIRPLPSVGLKSRKFSLISFLALLFIGLPICLAVGAYGMSHKELNKLREADPVAYLEKIRGDDAKWLAELEVLKPEQYKAEMATRAANAAAEEAAKKKADDEAAIALAKQQADKLVAEKAKNQEEVRNAIGLGVWRVATEYFRKLDKDDPDFPAFLAEIEQSAAAQAKQIPSSDLQANRDAYKFLVLLQPDVSAYADKVAEYEAKISERKTALVRSLKTTVDKVEDVTWYKHPNQPPHVNSRSTAFFYIGRRGETGRPWLRLTVQYAASDWLFVDAAYAWHDGVKELLAAGPFERDHNSTIWEWVDVAPSDYQIEVMRSLATADEAIIRFEGAQYKKDVTLSAKDKKAIGDMLDAFDYMQSGIN